MESIVIGKKKANFFNKNFTKILIIDILGWLVYLISEFADSIIGGMMYGEEYVSAIEIVAPIYSFIYFVGTFISFGVGVIHLNAIGKNDFKKADTIFTTNLILSIIFSLVTGLTLYIFKEQILGMFEISSELYNLVSDYYDPFVLVGFTLPLGVFIYNIVGSEGEVARLVLADLFQMIVNVVFSIVLIKIMGIKGLAYATFFSTLITYIVAATAFLSKKNTCHLIKKFDIKEVFSNIKIGLPTAICTLAIALLDFIMNIYILNRFGELYVAPYAIVNFALEVASSLTMVGSTMEIFTAISIGEKNNIDFKDGLTSSFKHALFCSLFFSVLMVGASPFVSSLFGITDPQQAKYCFVACLAIGLTYIGKAFLYIIIDFYLSKEKILFPLIASILDSFVIQLIVPIILSFIFDYYGFIVGFALSTPITLLLTIIILKLANHGKVFKFDDYNDKEYAIEYDLKKEDIGKVIEKLDSILKNNNINNSLSNKIELTIEEALNIISDYNANKIFECRMAIIFRDNKVVIYEKDGGKVFNLLDSDQKVNSLANYIFVNLSSQIKNKTNYVSTSLNANKFEFEIN